MEQPRILVTGASRGIGKATAEMLQLRGAQVLRHASRTRGTDIIAADFSEPSAAQILWQEALARSNGRLDVLVNNAGYFAANPVDSSDIEWLDRWEETLRINLTAAAQLSRFAIRHWQETGTPGRIVHIASRAGHRGDSPDHWHYAAAKGGMLAMHKTIARAYAGQGVMSYAITPGFTDTSLNDDFLDSRGGPALLNDIPLGRVARPEEIARIAVFCALDAPESMTGATLDANGASYVR
ncbi:SDR family oxidoreductase [Altericroceibacterium spongiae]|uniref:SDR family oxidoreductase n=1 Tax=Altericroceibacterium spongiae TaxID=2320269 RepID=A0A420EF41_9SPHN|nr:SDR family oxidoreductase [Altericroceibacterium spongiae]RKF19288.1 SDR family oxidoreductase [Altericroceibacterium spongiae]